MRPQSALPGPQAGPSVLTGSLEVGAPALTVVQQQGGASGRTSAGEPGPAVPLSWTQAPFLARGKRAVGESSMLQAETPSMFLSFSLSPHPQSCCLLHRGKPLFGGCPFPAVFTTTTLPMRLGSPHFCPSSREGHYYWLTSWQFCQAGVCVCDPPKQFLGFLEKVRGQAMGVPPTSRFCPSWQAGWNPYNGICGDSGWVGGP